MKCNKALLNISIVSLWIFLGSCKKNWLDQKPDSHLAVLQDLDSYQKLLDNPNTFSTSPYGEIGTDNYFIPQTFFSFLSAVDIAQYIWAPEGMPSSGDAVWSGFYKNIFSYNSALDGLSKITITTENSSQYFQVYGSALFFRALDYFELAQAYCKVFDSTTASATPGLPLRLVPNISQKVNRSSVLDVYNQIFSDLLKSKDMLPNNQQIYLNRPNKAAAFALLARVYLSIGAFQQAYMSADSAMQMYPNLLDYNTITPGNSIGLIPALQNPEVIYYSFTSVTDLATTIAKIDTTLLSSYDSNDLRKTCFFRFRTPPNQYGFKGTYDGKVAGYLFTAPAVDELYLIHAECNARLGRTTAAMNDLNILLINRWKTGTFVPLTASSPDDALSMILVERRKELVMRCVRWTDLRRLNKDSRFMHNIIHIYNANSYTLFPGSNLYVYPIPNDEVLYSGISNNPR